MHQKCTLPRPHCTRLRCRAPTLIAGLVAALTLHGCAGLPWGKAPPPSLRGGYAAGDKVTVILPGTGLTADAANALRAGLRAANGADDTAARPALSFITNDQPDKIAAAHKQAVSAGATQVIGPLLKPAVDALAGGPALKVPTLALNQTTMPGKAAANLYQFALAPETDAVEVANQARALGFTRALIVAPKGEAGQRRVAAFRHQWQRLGGTLVATADLDPAAANPAKALSALLHKGTADMLFLAADGDQARALYPAIRDEAVALPVIATSAVYSGQLDPARDRALTGLYFVDAPWVLGVGAADDPLARATLKGGGALATPLGLRLYAMGIDAYRLAPRLPALAKDRTTSFPGATGRLSLDAAGRVQRQLMLAQFTASGPHPATTMAPTTGAAAAAMPVPPVKPAPPPAKPTPAVLKERPADQAPRPEPVARPG